MQSTLAKSNVVRAYISRREGVEGVHVTRSGEVYVYGPIPNSEKTGWYLAGYVDALAAECSL